MNITEIFVTFDIFHFDISSKFLRFVQLSKIHFIFTAFDVSQFDISGKEIRDEQLINRLEKNVINCGVGGQGANTALNILNNNVFENLIPENSKVKHCFYTLIKDHIYRNFRCEGHCIDSFIYENDKYIRVKQPYGIFKNIFARCYIFKKVFLPLIDEHNEDFYEDYLLETLRKINDILQEKYNADLTLIIWPGDPEKYSENFINKLKQIKLGVLFVPENFLLYDLGYKVKNDGHPTLKANEVIAENLYNYITIN